MPEKIAIQIEPKDHKKRLDAFLYNRFPHLSRLYLRELVRDEKCEVNGRFENRGYKLRAADFVEVEIDLARQTSLQPERIALEIIFEDREILVINKPSRMLVHPTARVRTGTLLNALAFYLNANSEESADFRRAGLVHRLDFDTSGLVIVAKTVRAHGILARHFQRKMVEKRYLACVVGVIEPNEGQISAPIGRFAEQRIWNIKADGKPAVTNFWVKQRYKNETLIELEPVTGRTNQLRIHLAHLGHPIIGDRKYGGPEFSRLCLHAYKLAFRHPSGGERLEFEIGLPIEMQMT